MTDFILSRCPNCGSIHRFQRDGIGFTARCAYTDERRIHAAESELNDFLEELFP